MKLLPEAQQYHSDQDKPVTSGTSSSECHNYGLKRNALTPLETLAQSVAGIAPTAAPAVSVSLVFSFAQQGTWLVYLIATVAVLLTAWNINVFSRRFASPGSLYSYVTIGLGPACGILTGWALLWAYIIGTSLSAVEFSIFGNAVLKNISNWEVSPFLFMAFCMLSATVVAYKNIKLSAELMLWVELVSMSLILMLVFTTLAHHNWMDLSQLTLTNISPSQLSSGLVLAILAFIGFESAASLGSEAKVPLKTIPQAITYGTLISGLFFVVASYAIVAGFQGSPVPLEKCSNPLFVLANQQGVSFLGVLTNIGAAISFFACSLAALNAGARTLFLMGRHGIFHSAISKVHANNQTPHVAVIVAAFLGMLPVFVLSTLQYPLLDIIGWLGSLITYGCIAGYVLVSLAAPAYLYRYHVLKPMHILMAFLSLAAMSLAFIGNIYPPPPVPYNWLPYVFLIYMSLGIAWYFILKLRCPESLRLLEKDLAPAHDFASTRD